MNFLLNAIAGLYIMLAGAFIKFPVAMLLIGIGKAITDPVPKALSFWIGVAQDTFGCVCAISSANYAMLRSAESGLSWTPLIVLCFLVPWLSWDRMMNTSAGEMIRWHEIGCNVGRVVGLILGGVLFL